MLEVHACIDVRRDQALIESEDQFVIHQNIESPRLVLELANLPDQSQVVRQKWCARFKFALDQRFTNEKFSRLRSVDWTERNPALCIHH